MSYVSCPMSYVSCLKSYVLCLMSNSYVLYLMNRMLRVKLQTLLLTVLVMASLMDPADASVSALKQSMRLLLLLANTFC
jgi:hypothetical protein